MSERRWFSIRDAAIYLGVDPAAVLGCVYAGMLGFRRAPADGSVFFSREGLDAVVAQTMGGML